MIRTKQAHFTCEECEHRVVQELPRVPFEKVTVFALGPCEECGHNGWKKTSKLYEVPYTADQVGPDVADPTVEELLRLCQLALNEIPRTKIRHPAFSDSYQVAAYIGKHYPLPK